MAKRASSKTTSKSKSRGKRKQPRQTVLEEQTTTTMRPVRVVRREPVTLARVIGETITVEPGVERTNQVKTVRRKAA
jgi:hypothetical protein